MWRKIHSNRDPGNTLYSEVRKEFGAYFFFAGNTLRQFFSTYPRFCFYLMVFLMVLSLGLSFGFFRTADKKTVAGTRQPSLQQDGLSQVIAATKYIRETLYLKKMVDSLSARKRLSSADSAMLDSTLDRLSKIHQTLK